MPGSEAATSAGYAAHSADVRAAAARLEPFINKTPVVRNDYIDKLAGFEILFKCEMLQKSGAFKFRGAMNSILDLLDTDPDYVRQKGVITHSSGNHGAAVALAAWTLSVPASVIVPHGTPLCKVNAIRSHGARLIECEPSMDSREETCRQEQETSGAVLVPPYNYPQVIAGQGTAALEMLQQVEQLAGAAPDAILVPVSGGGLISGVALVAKQSGNDIAVVAAEPCGTNGVADAKLCKAAGSLVNSMRTETIAEGLQGRLGSLTWPIVRDLVDDVMVVSEAEIVAAMKLIMEHLKLVAEPSGAVALAAALSDSFTRWRQGKGIQRVAVVLSGGNTDLTTAGLWEYWEKRVEQGGQCA